MTKNLLIKNFKSIKEMNIECKRINLFIGKPNVGKSNILEALSIFNLPDAINQKLTLNDLIRYNNYKNLFYDNLAKEDIIINIDSSFGLIEYNSETESLHIFASYMKQVIQEYKFLKNPNYEDFGELASTLTVSNKGNYFLNFVFSVKLGRSSNKYFHTNSYKSAIRSYSFNKKSKFNHSSSNYLLPPYGQNLFSIIRKEPKLNDELAEYFLEYGLPWVYDEEENVFLTQKQIKNTIYKYHFNTVADTLQRMIFYTTAIETNKDCILVFEEPETNSFPPYTKELALKIANNKENQYFISTHSPYLLSNLIENTEPNELNIFLTYYDKYETKVKALSPDEIQSLVEKDIDIFFNMDRFINNA